MDNELELDSATQIDADDYKVICVLKEDNMLVLENKGNKEMVQIPITPDVCNIFNVQTHQETSDSSVPSQQQTNEYSSPKFWNDKAVKFLIFQYSSNEDNFKDTKVKNDVVWKSITKVLNENGFNFNTTQVINKWKHLRKLYIKEKDSMGPKSTGSEPVNFKYYDEMDALFNKKPNIQPISIASSSKGSQMNKEEVSNSFNRDLNQEIENKRKLGDENDAPAPSAKRTKNNTLLQWLEKREEKRDIQKKQRHAEMLATQKDAQEMFKNVMEKLIDKL